MGGQVIAQRYSICLRSVTRNERVSAALHGLSLPKNSPKTTLWSTNLTRPQRYWKKGQKICLICVSTPRSFLCGKLGHCLQPANFSTVHFVKVGRLRIRI